MWFSKFFKKQQEPQEAPVIITATCNGVKFDFNLSEFLALQQDLANHQLLENQANLIAYIGRKQGQTLANDKLFYEPLAKKGVEELELWLKKR